MTNLLTKSNKSLFIIAFFLFCSFTINGGKMSWGPKLPIGMVYMIAESDGVLYNIRITMKKAYLEKSNSKTLEPISSEEIYNGKSEFKERIIPYYGFIDNENIVLIGVTHNKGIMSYYGTELNLNGTIIRPWNLLYSGEHDIVINGELFKMSPDQKTLVLGMCHSEPRTKTHTYSLIVLDTELNKKWEKVFTLRNDEKQMHIQDLQIDNSGSIYLLASYAVPFSDYVNQVLEPQQVSGATVYATYDGISENVFTREIEIESGHVYSAKLELDTTNENIVLCGLYTQSEDIVEGLTGLFYTRFKIGTTPNDFEFTEVSETFVTELVQASNYGNHGIKKRNYSAFTINKLVPTPDGGFICVGECLLYKYGSSQNPEQNPKQHMPPGYAYESNSLFAVKFSSTSNMEFTKILPYKCELSIRHSNNGNSFLVIPRDSYIDIFYADHPKNTEIDGARKEFDDLKAPSEKRRIIVRSRMAFDGEITHSPLDPGKTENISPFILRSTISADGRLFISGSAMKGLGVNTYIGKIDLKK